MASFKMKVLGPWKQVKTGAAVESNPDFLNFGGMEVLENYEFISVDGKEQPGQVQEAKTVKTAKNKKRKLVKPTGPEDEEIPQLVPVSGSAKDDSDEPVAKKAKKKQKKKPKVTADDKNKQVTESESTKQEGKVEKISKKKRKPAKKKKPTPVTKDNAGKVNGGDSTTEVAEKPVVGMEGWDGLFVPDPVLRSLSESGFTAPTLIQALALPAAIRDKQDILGAAETGSGKTLAFGIPLIERILAMKERRRKNEEEEGGEVEEENDEEGLYALVLTPTRELCVQVKDHIQSAAKYTGIKVVPIFGGMASQKQSRLLKFKPEIIVATPGRLWDMMKTGDEMEYLSSIARAPMLVIDEADRMVEKGHFEELTQILNLMKKEEGVRRQCFVFSATLTYVHLAPDRGVQKGKTKKRKQVLPTKEAKINELIDTVGILRKPKVIDITEKSQTAGSLVESCIFCTNIEKDVYLYYFLQRHPGRTLIFTNSIDCIRRLMSLFTLLKKALLPLHASMHQKQRLKNLEKFTANENAILLATDVAARGLDIPNVRHVIHYQIPRTAEGYVHRSGRTARALKDGLSVMIVDEKDIKSYKKILKGLQKDDTMSQFPVEQEDLKTLKPIVSLAQRIDSTQHKKAKAKRSDDWFTKMAKEADLELSDRESDGDKEELTRITIKEKRKLNSMKAELASLMSVGGAREVKYRGKYPTLTGKLQLPKTVNTTKETQAITLISRKRR